MPKGKTSYVWEHFVVDPTSGVRKCKRCPYNDRSKSTTTAMCTHLRVVHQIFPSEKSENSQSQSSSNSTGDIKNSSGQAEKVIHAIT
jgi:hypothetical protein